MTRRPLRNLIERSECRRLIASFKVCLSPPTTGNRASCDRGEKLSRAERIRRRHIVDRPFATSSLLPARLVVSIVGLLLTTHQQCSISETPRMRRHGFPSKFLIEDSCRVTTHPDLRKTVCEKKWRRCNFLPHIHASLWEKNNKTNLNTVSSV